MDINNIIMIIYLAAMLCLGIYCVKYIKTFDDFFVAGRRLGFWMSLGTMASIFVGGSAIGVAGMAHEYGIGAFWYYAAFALGFFILAKTFVGPLRSLEQYTIADIFEARYDGRARMAASIIIFIAWLFFFAALVVGGARVIEVSLGWSLPVAIIVVAGVFTIYTSIGGMWAVTMTDFVQFIILVIGLIVIFPLSIAHVGGLGALMNSVPADYTSIIPVLNGSEMVGVGMVFATFILTTPTTIVAPDVYLRIWCMKDDRSAKKVLYALAALLIVFSIMLTLTGLAAYVVNPGVDHEMSLPLMVKQLLPVGISGLMLVALLAASVSGAVPEVVVCASILARDIYQKFINPNADGKKLLKMSRIFTFLVGVIGMCLALCIPGVMDLTFQCYRIFIPAAVPATIAAFYSRKTSGTSALVSMIIGPVVSITCMIAFPESYKTFFDPVIPGLIASTAAMLITNRFTKPTEKQVAFYDNVHAKMDAAKLEKAARAK